MPPCYTWTRACLPDDGRQPCSSAGAATPGVCPTATWFWILGGLTFVAVAFHNHKGGRR